MARSVRIDEVDARAINKVLHAAWCDPVLTLPEKRAQAHLAAALARLDRAPAKARPKRKPRPTLGDVDLEKNHKAEKRERRAAIREKVFARAAEGQPDGVARCEGPLGSQPLHKGRCINPATDLQHVFGRGKGREPESERNCLAACRTCHDAEGRNDPSGAAWWSWFADWFHEKGFFREEGKARSRAFLEATRAALPAAPRVRL